jgi:hypothetical protein
MTAPITAAPITAAANLNRMDECILVRRECRNFCVEIAKSIPGFRAQGSFLRLAASWELEARLLERSSACLAESRELIAKASSLLAEPSGDHLADGN